MSGNKGCRLECNEEKLVISIMGVPHPIFDIAEKYFDVIFS